MDGAEESASSGLSRFIFDVYPTRPPAEGKQVQVNVVAPTDINGEAYVTVNGANSLVLTFTTMVPQSVEVNYNNRAQELDITEKNLMIQLGVEVKEGTTTDPAFLSTSQAVLPVDIKLIPSKESLKA
eukprot:9476567-Ditylum_brightwellii.AAC.1